jgi:hypothetical protein
MAMGRSDAVQGDLMATWAEMRRSPGHAFYDRLQDLLREARFDAIVEGVCRAWYARRMGAPSLPPGRYFRMHMIGYFEGIDSERGIAWRCADSFSLRDFLRLSRSLAGVLYPCRDEPSFSVARLHGRHAIAGRASTLRREPQQVHSRRSRGLWPGTHGQARAFLPAAIGAGMASRRLTSRFKLTPDSAASIASARCNSGGMRAWNFPE